MKPFTAICAAAAMSLLLVGCNATATDTREADIKALRDNETQWNQDFVSKDAEKLTAHYADNAVLMSPGMASTTGKDAIRKTFAQMVTDPALTLKFQASMVQVSKSGHVGFTQGTYQMTMTDPASKQVIHDHGSYVTTYAKQADGSWKALADIASSEMPPAAH